MESSLLVVVIDISPIQKYLRSDQRVFFKTVDALMTFCNAHLMLQAGNQVAFITSHVNHCYFIYPPPDIPNQKKPTIRQQDGQYEIFLEFEHTVRHSIKKLIEDKTFLSPNMASGTADRPPITTSSLASGLSRALCYVNRRTKELQPGDKLNSRILVVTGSSESTSQYMSFMNVFFAAQKIGVIIDACVLETYATLLSQGADITGGIYLRPPQVNGLLEYLMWIFLPDSKTRKQLALPPPVPVDYRAACFCHRQLISSGFVCSVCLSIFCKYSPICTTCNAVFKAPVIVPASSKKRHLKRNGH